MIVAIDLETTGVDKKVDKIIEIALVKFDENTFEIIEEYSTFVYPEISIPPLISNITNIYDEDVFSSPTIDEISFKILDFIGDSPILGHNIFFDRDFLIENKINISKNILLDTFFIGNFLCFKQKSLNLEFLCKYYNVPFIGAHRALNDIKATILLFKNLINDFRELPNIKKELFFYISSQCEDLNIVFLRELLFFKEDIKLLSKENFQKEIVKIVGRYEPEKKEKNQEKIKTEKVKVEKFEKLYKKLGNIEQRENQLKMTNLVYETLVNGKKTVIEAPTGIGKSFAYLIPSIVFFTQSSQKVFISTKTKTLQDQLFYKDLDFLHKNLGIDFSYSKIKGKSNYFSLKGFFDEIYIDNFIEYEKVSFLLKIINWLFETTYGELDELIYYSKEHYYLKHINSESSDILKDDNKFKNYEFLFKARQKLLNSDIIVINHSLLFSDIGLDNSNLGKINNLIIDEAHSIEDSVTDSLRKRFSKKTLEDNFSFIEKILNLKKIKKIKFLNRKDDILDKISLLTDYSLNYLNKKNQNNQYTKTTLVKEDFFSEINFEEIIERINLDFIDLLAILKKISSKYEVDFSREISTFQVVNEIINIVFNKDSKNHYIPILTQDYTGLFIEYTLLNPGKYLEENLWNKLESLVLTSATLKIGDSFDYFKNMYSLKDDFSFITYSSDFDYKNQATLFIPNDLGNIKNNSNSLLDFLRSFYEIVMGRTLTLFTSFNSIKDIYTSLNLHLKKQGINLYSQGIFGGKNKLISFFLENPKNSILLGTDSFWEGIDIPGEDLKYLVIYKIPFLVPTDPIFVARSSLFQNAFLEYSVPKSIIKLKQGFGRLIRSKKDTGIVILLDDRVYSTKWGNLFYQAFPSDINIKIGKSKTFLDCLNKDNK